MGLKCLYLLPLLLLLQGIDTNSDFITGSCDSNPCKDGSTCEDRADKTHICLCETGDYYDYEEHKCISAKVFSGELFDPRIYYDEMADKKSKRFKEAAVDITDKFDKKYDGQPANKYLRSIVLEIINLSGKATGVIAKVQIIFDLSSPVTLDDVEKDWFEVTELCPSKPCDVATTTNCEEDPDSVQGVTCACKDEYVKSLYSDLLCVACPNGEKAVEGVCEKYTCTFGYTGFNCEDNWLLIFVIVASVLGAFLLIAIIVLLVVVVTSKKKINKAKTTDFEKPYSNSAPDMTPGLAVLWPPPVRAAPASAVPGYGGYGVPRVPSAEPNDYWDRNTKQEMVPNNSRQNFFPRNSFRFDDHDDRNPDSRPMKQQNNLYGGGRTQTNPYASNQGYSNPYYRH